jgi:hypothetical protein
MKRFAESEDPVAVVIPMLVRPRDIPVQLELGTVPVQVEDVRVAIAVAIYRMPSVSLPSVKARYGLFMAHALPISLAVCGGSTSIRYLSPNG